MEPAIAVRLEGTREWSLFTMAPASEIISFLQVIGIVGEGYSIKRRPGMISRVWRLIFKYRYMVQERREPVFKI